MQGGGRFVGVTMDAYSEIAGLMLTLAAEGVPQPALDLHEAALVVLLSKARQVRQASDLLARFGPDVAARRQACCRATIYNRAKKSRKVPAS